MTPEIDLELIVEAAKQLDAEEVPLKGRKFYNPETDEVEDIEEEE